jgi:hypothetical protein
LWTVEIGGRRLARMSVMVIDCGDPARIPDNKNVGWDMYSKRVDLEDLSAIGAAMRQS